MTILFPEQALAQKKAAKLALMPNALDAAFKAAWHQKDYAKIKMLLENGANPNLIIDNATPLIHIVGTKKISVLKMLLEHGANPNFSVFGTSALFSACEAPATPHRLQILEALLYAGARPAQTKDLTHSNGPLIASPVAKAARKGFTAYLRLFQSFGINIIQLGPHEIRITSPFLEAVRSGSTETVGFLLSAGADLFETDPTSRLNAWDIAKSFHLPEMIAYLNATKENQVITKAVTATPSYKSKSHSRL